MLFLFSLLDALPLLPIGSSSVHQGGFTTLGAAVFRFYGLAYAPKSWE